MSQYPSVDTVKVIDHYLKDFLDSLVAVRRDLHQHPELSGEESWTTAYIARQLKGLGLRVRTNVGGHGILADLVTDPAKPTVALRVDMDALPIQEINAVPYRSRVPGVMHACGHDVHSAIGIGAARVLSQMKADLPGNVRFIFQPEEEQVTGALRMIQAGALAHPTPAAIFGLHVAPLPFGKVAWTEDLFLAGFDHYLATILPQRGTHPTPGYLNAVAQRCCRAICRFNQWELPQTWEAMQGFWELLQEAPSDLRRFILVDASLNEEDPDAWCGQFGIGVKAADHHLRRAALGRIRASLNRICRATHTRYKILPVGSMPDMRNHQDLVQAVLPALAIAIGEESLLHLQAAFPFNCEDFAFFAQRIPGAMFWLGAANPAEKKVAMLHTPDFDVDERCILTGVKMITTVLLAGLIGKTG